MSVWTDHYPNAGMPYDPNNPPPSGELISRPPRPHQVKSLRDEFAMAALPALISGTKQSDLPREARQNLQDLGAHLAKMTFAIADAMMAERSKREG